MKLSFCAVLKYFPPKFNVSFNGSERLRTVCDVVLAYSYRNVYLLCVCSTVWDEVIEIYSVSKTNFLPSAVCVTCYSFTPRPPYWSILGDCGCWLATALNSCLVIIANHYLDVRVAGSTETVAKAPDYKLLYPKYWSSKISKKLIIFYQSVSLLSCWTQLLILPDVKL